MTTDKTPAPLFTKGRSSGALLAPPATTEERLHRIEVMGQQITGHVQFVCGVGALGGASAEAKEKAVLAFYERLVAVERQLGRIVDELRLG